MIIQLILTVTLVVIALFVALQKPVSRGVKLIVFEMLAIGGYLVWHPDEANATARALGIGRGADLLLYLWIVITFGVIFLLYLKISQTNRMVTELARQLALNRPLLPATAPERGCGAAGDAPDPARREPPGSKR